jgi:hypothetical protein
MIAKKVYASHAPKVQARAIAEHVHGCQLVETLLPLCEAYGLCIDLYDGGDYTPIKSAEAMAKHMNACDEEWLFLSDCNLERTADDDITYVSIALVYGNDADDPETGRGEMVADWSASCTDWWDIFDPVLEAFIDNREVEGDK